MILMMTEKAHIVWAESILHQCLAFSNKDQNHISIENLLLDLLLVLKKYSWISLALHFQEKLNHLYQKIVWKFH